MAQKKFFDGLNEAFRQLPDFLSSVGKAIQAVLHPGQSIESKEEMEHQFDLNNQLAENDLTRKEQFYEQFESPEAQVRQYKSAGLNPMLMYSSGAGVSASGGTSASGVSGGSGSGIGEFVQLISSMLNYKLQSRSIENQFHAQRLDNLNKEQSLQIQRQVATAQAEYWKNLGSFHQKRVEEINQNMQFVREMFPLNKQILQDQHNQYLDQLKNTEVQRRLAEQNISESRAREALDRRQSILLYIQEQYSNDYYRLRNEAIEAQRDLTNQNWYGAQLTNEFAYESYQNRMQKISLELDELVARIDNTKEQTKFMKHEDVRGWWKMGNDTVRAISGAVGVVLGANAFMGAPAPPARISFGAAMGSN